MIRRLVENHILKESGESPTTRIELILDGDNYEINLRIRYISKELKEWADKIKEEKTKSNF